MRRTGHCIAWLWSGLIILALGPPVQAVIVYEVTSPYHHIRVIDQQGLRTLSFDNSMETRMSLVNPLQGHFEYTEFFHLPWLWNPETTNVLMIGLGGGSTQRAYQFFYPQVMVDTVEMDPIVVEVAKDYFQVRESPTLRIHVLDGRVFLRRADTHYDSIIMDAYVAHRYGSFIPYHLATREFFQLASDKLTADGVLAYNVIGTLNGPRGDILGAIFKTMKTVFPQVYLFPATDSMNVVVIGTKSSTASTLPGLQQKAVELIKKGRIKLTSFKTRLAVFRSAPPAASSQSPVLTDDYAPIDGLLNVTK
jgi:spermidine synthase